MKKYAGWLLSLVLIFIIICLFWQLWGTAEQYKITNEALTKEKKLEALLMSDNEQLAAQLLACEGRGGRVVSKPKKKSSAAASQETANKPQEEIVGNRGYITKDGVLTSR
ncbi:MAG: hypothetical protein ABSB18_08170 [Candidatus Omnitrophota bacterium]